jgi:hypothetical protein
LRYTACQANLLTDILWSHHPMSQRSFLAAALVQAYRRQPGSRFATASLLFANLEFVAFVLPLFWEPLTSMLFGSSLGDPKLVFLG